MDAMIEQTINGLLGGFHAITVTDPAIKKEIEDYEQELRDLGEKSGDVSAFMTELQSSGLMQKNSDLMTKAATASSPEAADQAPSDTSASPPPRKLPTVAEFLEQYRASHDAVKGHGYQFRAEKAYERLFAVKDRTDDLLEMNIILEEEGHLRAIAAEALYDINKLAYDSQDPNHTAFRNQFKRMMDLAENYRTDPELDYETDRLVQQNQQESFAFNFMVHPVANLAHALLTYVRLKQAVWSGQDLEKYTAGFVIARENIKRTSATVQEYFGLNLDAIEKDPWRGKWLLIDRPVEALGLGTRCLNPENVRLYREALEEATSSKTDAELLLQPFQNPMHFDIDPSTYPEDKAAETKLAQEAEARLKHRYYYDYQKKVKAVVPTGGP
ncbi:MAG: hypothetical protein H7A22_04950 [Spirochaetales bacterium]|nr:hypothetical protein [Spirochaetales bacterium]